MPNLGLRISPPTVATISDCPQRKMESIRTTMWRLRANFRMFQSAHASPRTRRRVGRQVGRRTADHARHALDIKLEPLASARGHFALQKTRATVIAASGSHEQSQSSSTLSFPLRPGVVSRSRTACGR